MNRRREGANNRIRAHKIEDNSLFQKAPPNDQDPTPEGG